MKVTLKIGKKSQTVKIKTTEELGNFVHVLYGEILKRSVTPDIANDISCKLDGDKIEPKKLLLVLKDALKRSVKNEDSDSIKKKDKKSKKKKDKSATIKDSKKKKSDDRKKKDKKSKKDKDSKKSKKKRSLDFNKSSEKTDGLIRIHRRRFDD